MGDEEGNNQPLTQSFFELITDLLDTALQAGMDEEKFWNSTYGEIERYLIAYSKREELRMKENAIFTYKLAELIGVSNGRYQVKHFTYPEIYEVFPSLFSEEEIETKRQEERDRQSIERLYAMFNAQKEGNNGKR